QEISKVEVLGKDQNAYAQHDFSSPYYQGRELNFTVLPFNDPTSDRHKDPIVYMQNPGDENYYSLGIFAKNSSKLPVSATFTGQVKMNGRTVDLFVKPGSILVPEPEMPQSPKKLRSKHLRQEIKSTRQANAERLSAIKSRRKNREHTSQNSQKVIANWQFSGQTQAQSENQFEI
ncbi:MAG: hypothetical protein ACRC8K_22530, partial [Waterburya sp.]